MICVSIDAVDFEECESLLRKHSFFEFRLDKTRFTLEEVKQLFSMPSKMIATCRPGKFTDEKRKELLQTAIKAGAIFVDIENDAHPEYIEAIKGTSNGSYCRLILSYHNTNETPDADHLKHIVDEAFTAGADIVKIACKTESERDNQILLSLYNNYETGKLISLGMGDKGKITRIAALSLGAPFTYASLERDMETAPGQIELSNMKKIYDLMR